MKRFDWKDSLAKAFGKPAGQIKIYHADTGEEGLIYSSSELKQLLRNAYEKGWCESGQGHNAENHNLEPEELAEMRDLAVAKCIEEFEK